MDLCLFKFIGFEVKEMYVENSFLEPVILQENSPENSSNSLKTHKETAEMVHEKII